MTTQPVSTEPFAIQPEPAAARRCPEQRFAARLDDSVARASDHLLARQRADGSWDESCDGGAASTAQALVALEVAGRLEDDVRRRALATLAALQRDDGGYEAFPGAGRSDAAATASALAAFVHVARDGALDAARRRAEQFLASRGGVDGVVACLLDGDLAPLFLAVAGVLPADRLPRVPSAWLLSATLRACLERRAHSGAAMTAGTLALTRGWLRGEWGDAGPLPGSLAARVARVVVALHDEVQNPNGGFVNIVPHTAAAIIALRAAGVARGDDRVARAAAFLLREAEPAAHGGVEFPVFHSSVWSTALSLRALVRGGLRADSTAAEGAVRWLLAAQAREPQARANQRVPRAVRSGGFGFQHDNVRMPDSDDTAVALDALGAAMARGELHRALRADARAAVARALAWLYAMQNGDGGWPAFVHGLPGKPPGPIMTAPLRELVRDAAARRDPRAWMRVARAPLYAMGDPSTEDVTARVLRALACHGADARHPLAARGVAFLVAQRCASGAFWGRWSTNYLWATAHVLLGARAAGVDPRSPWVARARAWVLGRQNADGGFGETVASYGDPSRAGEGPSMPAVTALVLEALVGLGCAATLPATRAATYLLDTQRAAGDWPDAGHLQVIIPPHSFYRYPGAGRFQPLEALAAYREALGTAAGAGR